MYHSMILCNMKGKVLFINETIEIIEDELMTDHIIITSPSTWHPLLICLRVSVSNSFHVINKNPKVATCTYKYAVSNLTISKEKK